MRAVGPYLIEGELGRGGAGVVLRGRRPGGAAVAIKVLLHGAREAAVARFARERELHQQLARSGAFVPILDAGVCEQGPFMVMPLLPGGTLRAQMRAGPWDAEDVLRLGQRLAGAMGHAHALGVVHRDLKPDNILHDAEGTPLIADLGLGKRLDGSTPADVLTRTGTMAGTSGYAAPEQMIDAKRVSPAADVFAIGAILYECLTGRLAFPGATLVDVLSKIQRGGLVPVAELRPDAPPALARVIERCLAADPAERYPDGAALANALLLSGATAPTASPWRIVAGAIVVSALLISGALLVRGRSRAPVSGRDPTPASDPPAPPAPPPVAAPPTEPPSPGPPSPGPPSPGPPAVAPSSLSEGLIGLGGLTVEGLLGTDARRFAAPLRFLAASPRGLFGCDAGGTVRGFDPVDLRETFAQRLVDVEPTAFALSPDGASLAVAARGELVVHTPGRTPATSQLVAPEGLDVNALAVTSAPTLVVWVEGTKIRAYDRDERRPVIELAGHTADVTALALGQGYLVSADASGALVHFRTGPTKPDWGVVTTWNCGRAITCLTVSSDRALIAGASADGTWSWWDPQTGRTRGTLALPDTGVPLAARFVEQGRALLLATSSHLVRVRLADRSLVAQQTLERPAALAAFDLAGTREVYAERGGSALLALNVDPWGPLPPPPGHLAPLSDGAVWERGFLTIDATGRARSWAADGGLAASLWEGGEVPGALDPRPSVAAGADGHALLADRNQALLVTPSGSRTLDEPGVTCVARGPEGRFLAGTATGHVLWIDSAGQVVQRDTTLAGGRVLRLVPTADGLLALAEKGGQTWLWNSRPKGPPPQRLPRAVPGALAVVAGGRAAVGTSDGTIKVQTPHMGGRMVYDNQAHQGPVLGLAGSPDGERLLSAGADETIAVWRVQTTGQLELLERRTLDRTGDRIHSLTPLDGRRLLVGTARGVGLICRW